MMLASDDELRAALERIAIADREDARRRAAARRPLVITEAEADARLNAYSLRILAQRERELQPPPPPDTCKICNKPMLDDGQQLLVAMRCTEPPEHVFHEECLMQWRRDIRVETTARLCPTCGCDPTLMIKARRHLAQVQRTIQRERTAWCVPRLWAHRLRVLAVWSGIVLLTFVCLAFLLSVLWTALTYDPHTATSPAPDKSPVIVMRAPESRDADLL